MNQPLATGWPSRLQVQTPGIFKDVSTLSMHMKQIKLRNYEKLIYTWEFQMYGFFCRFRISAEFSDFALKNGFRRNSIIGDQFRRNWLLNVCPSKVRKHVGRFRRNCPQFRRNYPDSALVTNIHSPWKPYFGRIENCRQFFLFSAKKLEFGDSCAEM